MNTNRSRLPFNAPLGTSVAAPETAPASARTRRGAAGGGSPRLHALAAALVAARCLTAAPAVVAAPPLPAGTLPTQGVVKSGTATISAPAPVQIQGKTYQTLNINQASQKATIHWQQFNVAPDAAVRFVQQQGASSATLNRVVGNERSLIQGLIQAPGQVYIINRNGILFDRSSQVNVGSLVASALNVSDEVLENGLTSLVPKDEFTAPTPAFQWEGDAAGFQASLVRVDAGATIRTTNGGRVILLAPRVENQGRIETPEGQTILAAGAKVYLTAPLDSSLRGFLVEVDPYVGSDAAGNPVNLGGTVVNQKADAYTERTASNQLVERVYNIVAKRGNVTLAGLNVQQEGRILATTTVDQNGSIIIQARDTWSRNERRDIPDSEPVFIPKTGRTGNVTLGVQSETSVLPETAAARSRAGDWKAETEIDVLPPANNTRSLTDDQRFNPSRIELAARSIDVQGDGRRGAKLIAPSGEISLLAQEQADRQDPEFLLRGTADNGGVRVYVAPGSVVDVSGERGVQLPVARNIIEADLRASELKDAPLQRDGVLRGETVFIDLRKGSQITDVSPFLNQVKRGIAEKSAAGGTLSIKSEGDVVVRDGASIDASGGWLDYQGGLVVTTYLFSDGHRFDFASAPADRIYSGFVNVADQYERGYIEGKDAGTLQVLATRVVLDGSLRGTVRAGERQRAAGVRPRGGQLLIGDPGDPTAAVYSAIQVRQAPARLPTSFDFFTPAPDTLQLSSNVFGGGGFARFGASTLGAFELAADSSIELGTLGSFQVHAGTVSAHGDIYAPGGSIDLFGGADTLVGANATLSAAGLWTNDFRSRASGPSSDEAVAVNGGSVLLTGGDLTLERGSVVDVSAGAWLQVDGSIRYGDAGTLGLTTLETRVSDSDPTPNRLRLDGTLLGYAASNGTSSGAGGNLLVRTSRVTIGGAPSGAAGEWYVSPQRFGEGGFASFDITGMDGLTVAEGTRISLAPAARLLAPTARIIASGAAQRALTSIKLLPDEFHRPASSITLASDRGQQGFGSVTVGRRAVIDAGALGSVALEAQNLIAVDGTLRAAAGSISLDLPAPKAGDQYDPTRKVWLGGEARLLAPGTVRLEPNALALRQGDVLAGGRIAVSAANGFLVMQPGAYIDVSGTSSLLHIAKAGGRAPLLALTTVASDAGSITLAAREGMLLESTLVGAKGGPQARGGTLRVEFERNNRLFDPSGNPVLQALLEGPRRLVLGLDAPGEAGGIGANDALPATPFIGRASVPLDAFERGGFDSLGFLSENRIELADSLRLAANRSVSLEAPNLRTDAGAAVVVDAAYAALGTARADLQASARRDPAAGGAGTLNVSGQLVELAGHMALQGFGTTLISSVGDVRLRGAPVVTTSDSATEVALLGSLEAGGDVTVRATQVYPTTLSDYTFDLSRSNDATLRFEALAGHTPVLSAGGALRAVAPVIEQAGVLKAPFGLVDLTATQRLELSEGSLTSVSAEGQTIPFGRTTLTGRQYIYSSAGFDRVIDTPPEKRVSLDAPDVELAAGATVDLSGGGELLAWEFTPGPGGSKDVLDPANSPQTFAVLPGLGSGFGPYDEQAFTGVGNLAPGDSIQLLSAAGGLGAGTYTLLPARYALLPGGYLVTVKAGHSDLLAGSTTRKPDGSWLVAGRVASTNRDGSVTVASRSTTLEVASGYWARQRSEFRETRASAFFDGGAGSQAIGDAGRLSISARRSLELAGRVSASALPERHGAQVDIAADHLAVMADNGAAPDGFVGLDVTSLNRLNVESLLLGGTRRAAAGGVAIDVAASELVIDNAGGPALTAAEIQLAATGRVSIESGSAITAQAEQPVAPVPVSIEGNGAYVRVAAGPQTDFFRTSTSRSAGEVSVREGAALSGTSVILDATRDTRLAGGLVFGGSGGALAIGASRISAGETPAIGEGVVLSNDDLAALGDVAFLRLKSYSTFDLYGDVVVGSDALGELSIEAAGLAGLNNTDKLASLRAGRVRLSNSDGLDFATVAPAGAVPGNGRLQVQADTVVLSGHNRDASDFQTHGFGQVLLRGTKEIMADGRGRHSVDASLELQAGRITATSGSDVGIAANGALRTSQTGEVADPAPSAFGAKLSLEGASVSHGARIELPGGQLTLRANGATADADVTLLQGSVLSLGGAVKRFSDALIAVPGGQVRLESVAGGITVAAGASVDVSGAGGGDAGMLSLLAPAGSVQLAGDILGNAPAGGSGDAPRQGEFGLDAKSIADFSMLAGKLAAGGFAESLDLRVRRDDLVVGAGALLRAGRIAIAADDGSIEVRGGGVLDASGPKGGQIELYAANGGTAGAGRVVLHDKAQVLAKATASLDAENGTAGQGGRVTLGASGTTAENAASARLILVDGSLIDVSVPAGSQARAGSVLLRAPRIQANGGSTDNEVGLSSALDRSLTKLAGQIRGADGVVVEAVRAYDLGAGKASIDANRLTTWRTDTVAYMAAASAIETRLERASDATFHLRPGIEARSGGDIALATDWDLRRQSGGSFEWRYGAAAGDEPGVLTLRAGGDLLLNRSLSDAFSNALASGRLQQSGDSWSYRLVAGADLSAANTLAVQPRPEPGQSGNLVLAAARLVRTGNGTIDIATAGDLTLGAASSVIYTAGLADPPENHAAAGQPDRQFTNIGGLVPEYPYRGGDITIRTGGDIDGAGGDQWVNNWLYRIGLLDADGTFNSNTPAAGMRRPTWWPRFSEFRNGVAALGGGDVSISAGGRIENLGVASATNGRLPGSQNERPDASRLKVQGGGDVVVRAAGDIDSGLFHAGRGNIRVESGGALGTSRQTAQGQKVYSLITLGEGSASVRAYGDIGLESALNATLTPQSLANGSTSDRRSFFSTYGPGSGVELTSLSGNVQLINDTQKLGLSYALPALSSTEWSALTLYPGTVRVHALSGDIDITGRMTLAPSSRGQLELLASGSVHASNTINMSDLPPSALPTPVSPDNNYFLRIDPLINAGYSGRTAHGAAALHAGDPEPVRIVALEGNVSGPDGQIFLQLPKPFLVEAGQDLTGGWIGGQNLDADDHSVVRAGRDIRLDVDRGGDRLTSSNAAIEIGGPGVLEVRAGGSIDLGPSKGILSRGNFNNPFLAEGGAQLLVIAGTRGPDYGNLLFEFSNPAARRVGAQTANAFNTALLVFMRGQTADPDLDLANARIRFQRLGTEAKASFFESQSDFLQTNETALRNAFFVALRDSGRRAAAEGPSAYDAGYAAIAALFPDAPRSAAAAKRATGSVSLFRSQIKSEQGGGIDIVVPGGFVNVGVADSGVSSKPASDLGIITARGGSIRSMVSGDFEVNTSRVFTLQGGDILIWSSFGNIDAGKGAKTASATPPPQIILRGDQIILDTSNSVSGSGIGVLLGRADVAPGDVDLIAPVGTVNAGDAGIRAAGNLTIAAARVTGAENIQVGGVATGVPVSSPGTTSLSGLSNVAGEAAKSAERATQQLAAESTNMGRNSFVPSFITVEVIGLGDDEEEERRRREGQ